MLWAGVCQLSGGMLMWQAMRGQRHWVFGASGGLLLVAGGLLLSLLAFNVGRNFAAYGGMLAILSLIWGWHYSRVRPDIIDMTGTAMILGGVAIMILTPRT